MLNRFVVISIKRIYKEIFYSEKGKIEGKPSLFIQFSSHKFDYSSLLDLYLERQDVFDVFFHFSFDLRVFLGVFVMFSVLGDEEKTLLWFSDGKHQ